MRRSIFGAAGPHRPIIGKSHSARTTCSRRWPLPAWRERPGALGLRFSFNSPQTQAWLTDGTADWVWPAAERAGLPVALLAPGVLPAVGAIARRYPSLRIIVDHLGIPRGLKDAAAFAHLPEL